MALTPKGLERLQTRLSDYPMELVVSEVWVPEFE